VHLSFVGPLAFPSEKARVSEHHSQLGFDVQDPQLWSPEHIESGLGSLELIMLILESMFSIFFLIGKSLFG